MANIEQFDTFQFISAKLLSKLLSIYQNCNIIVR